MIQASSAGRGEKNQHISLHIYDKSSEFLSVSLFFRLRTDLPAPLRPHTHTPHPLPNLRSTEMHKLKDDVGPQRFVVRVIFSRFFLSPSPSADRHIPHVFSFVLFCLISCPYVTVGTRNRTRNSRNRTWSLICLSPPPSAFE